MVVGVLDRIDITGGCAIEGDSSQAGLEIHPGFEQLEGMRTGVVKPQVHRSQSQLWRQAGDKDATAGARTHAHQTPVAQDPQRLVHDCRTDAESFHELGTAAEVCADRQPRLEDLVLDISGYLLGTRFASTRIGSSFGHGNLSSDVAMHRSCSQRKGINYICTIPCVGGRAYARGAGMKYGYLLCESLWQQRAATSDGSSCGAARESVPNSSTPSGRHRLAASTLVALRCYFVTDSDKHAILASSALVARVSPRQVMAPAPRHPSRRTPWH